MFSRLFFFKLPATSCSFLRSTVGKSRRKAWPDNVTRKASTRSKKRQNAKWPEIRFLSRLDLIVARNKVFPSLPFFSKSTWFAEAKCQMDVLREDIGRSYSIDSHWHKSAVHQRPLPTGSTGHQLTSTSASEKLPPVSWEAELQILVNVGPSDSPYKSKSKSK